MAGHHEMSRGSKSMDETVSSLCNAVREQEECVRGLAAGEGEVLKGRCQGDT
jgi:hypothetical protein